ncbi:hypothetical protein, partial [Megasphaera sp.]|uniref:hypothetical protein n=1 Tax=Megasphaera sp. TaxID=2023260 RepID=UPI001DEC58A2
SATIPRPAVAVMARLQSTAAANFFITNLLSNEIFYTQISRIGYIRLEVSTYQTTQNVTSSGTLYAIEWSLFSNPVL